MSGTSMDGIDAALISTDGQNYVKFLKSASLSYHPHFQVALKAAEYSARKHKGDLALASKHFSDDLSIFLNTQFPDPASVLTDMTHYLYKGKIAKVRFEDIIDRSTKLHVNIVNKLLKKSCKSAKEIDLIGYHGQTLYHNPSEHITVQAGNIALLANELGITTVGNFRHNDVQNHGQGAPFAPLYLQALAVRDTMIPVAVINCGGVANMTIINSSEANKLLGFDCGPGNALIDQYLRTKTNNKELMDKDGKYGLAGTVNEEVLQLLCKKAVIKDKMNYLDIPPPKSLDSSNFVLIDELKILSFQDACATLEAFSAFAMVDSLKFFPDNTVPDKFVLSGGGWHNEMIFNQFSYYLKKKLGKGAQILRANKVGWDGDSIEAEIFAYLAARSLHKLPISYPNLTSPTCPTLGGIAKLPENGEITENVKNLLANNPDILNGYKDCYKVS
jgi:anhydro-N-acetylmuramic acid kinase